MYEDLLRQACKWPLYEVQDSTSFIDGGRKPSSQLCPGHWFARISASIYLQSLRRGLDEGREGLEWTGIGFYLHLTLRSHLRDQLTACWIAELCSCSCLLEAMSFTSIGGQFICQVIDKYQEQKGSKHKALRHTVFYDTFAREAAAQFRSRVRYSLAATDGL